MVYLLTPHSSALQMSTMKFRQDFIGPLFIDTTLDKTHYRLKDAMGLLLDGTYHMNHIKKGSVHTPQGIVNTFDDYKKTLKNTLLNKSVHFGSREKRAVPVIVILQAGAAIGGTLIKGINALVDAKRAKSFNNALKMAAANAELTHQKLRTLENRTSMMAKAIMPVLDFFKAELQIQSRD